MAEPERTCSLSELVVQHLSRNKELPSSTPASAGGIDSFLGLQQSIRGLLPWLTPSAPGFCRSPHQTTISQHSCGTDTDVRPNLTTLKGFPSLSELIQGHSIHTKAFSPLTSVKRETLAVPETTVSLAEIAAQHLRKENDLGSFKTTNSGGTDTLYLGLQDHSSALPSLLSLSHPECSLSSPQATISQQPHGVKVDVPPELFQDHSNSSSSVIKPLTSVKSTTVVENMSSLCELVEHLSMDTDLESESDESLANGLIFSETIKVSPSSLGTALFLSSSSKGSRKVRAETPPRCPTLTPAIFYLPPIRGESSDAHDGAAVSGQQKKHEMELKEEDVLVLWPGQIEVVKTNTFYRVLYHPLPKFQKADPQRPPIVPFKFDTSSPDDIALEKALKPHNWKTSSLISRRLTVKKRHLLEWWFSRQCISIFPSDKFMKDGRFVSLLHPIKETHASWIFWSATSLVSSGLMGCEFWWGQDWLEQFRITGGR